MRKAHEGQPILGSPLKRAKDEDDEPPRQNIGLTLNNSDWSLDIIEKRRTRGDII